MNVNDFKKGDRVYNNEFGRGVVIKLCKDCWVDVLFDKSCKRLCGFSEDEWTFGMDEYLWRISDNRHISQLSKVKHVNTSSVYIVLKCSGSSWPQDERVYGVYDTLEKANKAKASVQRKHCNDHIAVLKFNVE